MPFFILNAVLFTATTVMTYDTISKAKTKFDKKRRRELEKSKNRD
ncbi:hypothetical protein [Campylobacter ureolyticus]|nr:hypothetical protein [Campylobacter ureolyticus]MCZ6104865.1 hypothetical protein [Campylobacter ureolyticus]MCZ6157480.1 hypothetical protein [Campylobacter ureolyticus]GKH60099.1 hypothetical protein CE91St25_04350 [Campylobacter ureolyticus]